MKDKEAMGRIECALWENDYYQSLNDLEATDYRDRVILRFGKLFGYRKLPKGKPPASPVGYV